MRSGILRTYVATLRLRRDAPWPSQIRDRRLRWLRPLGWNIFSELRKKA